MPKPGESAQQPRAEDRGITGSENPESVSLFEIEDRFLEAGNFYEAGSPEDLRFKFMRRLVIVARQWRTRLDERLKGVGQTQARWVVMFWILASAKGTTQRELAERVGIEGPTLVVILQRLEQEGLIERRPVDGDRRSKTIALTEAAKDVVDVIVGLANELRAEALKGISPEELEAANSVFNRIRTNLEAL